jgi:PAS domain
MLKMLTSPLVRGFLAYWECIRAGRTAPGWAEIDPAAIKPLLPFLLLAEVQNEPFDLRYRLVGSEVVASYGYDPTWDSLRSTHRATEDIWYDLYRRVIETRRPCFGQYTLENGPRDVARVDTGTFPLAGDGLTSDRIIEVEDWEMARGLKHRSVDPEAWRFRILNEATNNRSRRTHPRRSRCYPPSRTVTSVGWPPRLPPLFARPDVRWSRSSALQASKAPQTNSDKPKIARTTATSVARLSSRSPADGCTVMAACAPRSRVIAWKSRFDCKSSRRRRVRRHLARG